jgi:hypothetical protein
MIEQRWLMQNANANELVKREAMFEKGFLCRRSIKISKSLYDR